MKKIIFSLMAVASAMMTTSCDNDDVEFDDYTYQTVSFAMQTPIRKITLGDDVYPTNLDNDHRFMLYTTLGGVWQNGRDRNVRIAVDETLCRGLVFEDGRNVRPLPADYYKMASNDITISSGEIIGGVDVQLTDKFFADPLSTTVTYVLPVRIVSASDSILSGKPKSGVTAPNPVDADDWDVLPKNYTLYAVKYKNKYHGVWLNRGTDHVFIDGMEKETIVREPEYIEDAGLSTLTTDGLQVSRYNVSVSVEVADDKGKTTVEAKHCDLILTFNADGNCTVTTDTDGATAKGTGRWEHLGAKKAWNNKDRDLLTLDYEFELTYMSGGVQKTVRVATSERLVMRDRGDDNRLETFSYTIRK